MMTDISQDDRILDIRFLKTVQSEEGLAVKKTLGRYE